MRQVGLTHKHFRVALHFALRQAIVCLCLMVFPVYANAVEPTKLALTKAAFVLNFSKYTQWPDSAFAANTSPMTVCILSADSDMGRALSLLHGKAVKERTVNVRVMAKKSDFSGCHVLYVEQSGRASFGSEWSALATAPVLTVGDGVGFAKSGGMIELVPSNSRLAFEVNVDVAKRADIRFSSQLLQLAQIVKAN